MKRITILLAALALICGQAQAQSFLDKIKQKAESAIGGSLGETMQGMIPEGMSQMAGQEYSVLYPVYIDEYDPWAEFVAAEPQTLYRSMYLEDKPLPPGTYYMQYIVYDMFMRPMPMETIEAEWTGESMILPEDYSWEGVEELTIPEEYW